MPTPEESARQQIDQLLHKCGWLGKCSREESNLHGFPHTVLSRTRLPFRHVSVPLSGL